MTITQKDIEALLGECVGEDTPNSSAELLGFKAYLREAIPETALKVLERVRMEVGWNMFDMETYRAHESIIERILASLAGEDEGDNGKNND